MKGTLEAWLTPGGSTFFAYDDVWGTLIGYPASYGSDTELNDHHFHYGYFRAGCRCYFALRPRLGAAVERARSTTLSSTPRTPVRTAAFPS